MGFGKVREDLGSDEYGRNQITWTSFWAYVKRYWLILFAPAMCWLLLDVGAPVQVLSNQSEIPETFFSVVFRFFLFP